MTGEQAETRPSTASEAPQELLLGTRLRRAREARSLALQEVAAHLHLHVRTIEALEADDHDNLPAPIFVRGYIRNYAKLLQLDGDALIASYDDEAGHDPQLTPPLQPPPQASSSDRPVKAMTYLLSLTLVLLLLAWWQSRHIGYYDDMPDMLAETAPEPPDDAPELLTIPGLDYPVSVVRHPDSPFLPRTDQPPAIADKPAMEIPTAIAAPEPEAALLPIEATGPAPSATPDAETQPPEVTAAGLELELTAESWIEVYDAAGKRLFHGMGRPGETLQFNGDPPLRVVLGYAPGVRVSYRGETFDPEPHSTAGVARFQIGD